LFQSKNKFPKYVRTELCKNSPLYPVFPYVKIYKLNPKTLPILLGLPAMNSIFA